MKNVETLLYFYVAPLDISISVFIPFSNSFVLTIKLIKIITMRKNINKPKLQFHLSSKLTHMKNTKDITGLITQDSIMVAPQELNDDASWTCHTSGMVG